MASTAISADLLVAWVGNHAGPGWQRTCEEALDSNPRRTLLLRQQHVGCS